MRYPSTGKIPKTWQRVTGWTCSKNSCLGLMQAAGLLTKMWTQEESGLRLEAGAGFGCVECDGSSYMWYSTWRSKSQLSGCPWGFVLGLCFEMVTLCALADLIFTMYPVMLQTQTNPLPPPPECWDNKFVLPHLTLEKTLGPLFPSLP